MLSALSFPIPALYFDQLEPNTVEKSLFLPSVTLRMSFNPFLPLLLALST